jgi:hypothetical protein
MFYTYKTTTEKLPDALQHIVESGDEIVLPQFVGGRDWIVVCRKGDTSRSLGVER